MFHSVGNEKQNWYRNWLSVSVSHFDKFCEYLVKNGYNTILLDEWYQNENDTKKTNDKNIVLTFDDGYLDNWVYAYPILKKYNLNGTVFINPEFVDPSIETRPNLLNVWDGEVKETALSTLGFLNWAEIKELQSSGIMDIQSHSMSHNFYFLSNEIKDIYHGQPNYDWLSWYEEPKKKPYYITESQKEVVPYGTPIFKFGRALGLRRYFPDENLIKYSLELSANKDIVAHKESIRKELSNKLVNYPGHYETDEEMENRYNYELFNSKKILEEKLAKKIEYLCWPGGGYNELSVNISKKAGYKASTISSKDTKSPIDNSGKYKRIRRYGMGSFIITSKKHHYIENANYLVTVFLSSQGHLIYKNLNRIRKLLLIIKDELRLSR